MKIWLAIAALFMLGLAGCTRPASQSQPYPPAQSSPWTPPATSPTPTSVSLPQGCQRREGRRELACSDPTSGLAFWLMPPDAAASAAAPLLLYLHGFDQSGSDLDQLLVSGLPAELEAGRSLAAWVVSPQCPGGKNWQSDEMVEQLSMLVSSLVQRLAADPKRVYLTGFSMGGDGAWALGLAHPDQFAAVVPVASWYVGGERACRLKSTPVWVFQSEADRVVDARYARDMVAALQSCGSTPRFTLYPQATHEETSRQAYQSDDLYAWMLDQKISH